MKRLLLIAFSTLALTSAHAKSTAVPEGLPADAVAEVGDQVITYSQLNTQLNSSAVVGVSVPVLGSPERSTVMLALLDKVISANLLYLDAIKRGADEDSAYQKELQTFSDSVLGELYRRNVLIGGIHVTADEVDEFIRENFTDDTEVTDRLRQSVEATLRNRKLAERKATSRARLREGIDVVIHADKLDVEVDDTRGADEVIAEYGAHLVTWEGARIRLSTLNNTLDVERRIESLNELIDQKLMASKGREAGLDRDPTYQKRLAEFRKTRLLNAHREALMRGMEPTDEELRSYYEDNRDRIAVKERRRIQMVVLPSRDQAKDVKAKIESGELTIYQAALEHSIDPNARQTLGDFGWVTEGTGFTELDKVTFALDVDKLGGPVESPAGWHLVKVLDMRAAAFTDFDEEETRTLSRRSLLRQRLDEHLVDLRRNEFPVVVYEENLNRLFQNEAQWIAAKAEEMAANPEKAEQILDELREVVE